MNGIKNTLFSILCRYLLSWSFIICSLIITLSLLFSCSSEMGLNPYGQDVLYLYWVAHWQGFNLVSIIIATYGSISFCNDWNSRFSRYIALRIGARNYSISQAISCIVIGISPVILGEILFIIALRSHNPLCNPFHSTLASRAAVLPYGLLLSQGKFILYLICNIIISTCRCAFFSSIGLLISAIYNNIFLTLASPLIVYFTSTGFLITPRIPNVLNIYAILEGICFTTPGTSLSYSIMVCTILCYVISRFSVSMITRRLNDA